MQTETHLAPGAFLEVAEHRQPAAVSSVFPQGYRAAGVLLHITSLPSPHGIGDLGPAAYRWIDCLANSGQQWWQILPIGPPAAGNSPYTPLSTFACNPLLISPEGLVDDGYLTADECRVVEPFPESQVDFSRVIPWKEHLLATAFANFQNNRDGVMARFEADFHAFCETHSQWLEDFALFLALKQTFNQAGYFDWPKPFVVRERAVLENAAIELASEVERAKFDQYLVFRQFQKLRAYAAERQVKLFGDLPIFVSSDSSEVWSHPDLFMLDENMRPKFVAGVPPDYFSETGQLWGNPVYNWEGLRRSGYAWWINRLRSLMQLHDLVRLDHFRGFCAAWHVPAGAETAVQGAWIDGPGADFFFEVNRALGGLPFVAEDLGTITDDVRALLAQFGLPKMGVLQFAFDGDPTNAFLPQHSVANMVAYTGTHDNDTSLGWYRSLLPENREVFWRSLGHSTLGDEQEVPWRMIEMAWGTQAAVAIAPLQDLLSLGGEARMNMPGIAAGNWAWRCTAAQLDQAPWEQLKRLTEKHQRQAST